MIINLQCYKN